MFTNRRPSATCNLQTADRIISINGQDVRSTIELRNIIDQLAVGDTVTVKLQRGIYEPELHVTLIEETGSGNFGNI